MAGLGGKRVRFGGNTYMAIGLVMLALGVGLTVLSFAEAMGTGGTFFIFPGFIIGGLVMFFRGAATSTVQGYGFGRRARNPRQRIYGTHARPAQLPAEDYVAPPGMMPAGYCWACGRKVRKGNSICYACGAAQVLAPPHPQHSSTQPPQPPYPGEPYPGSPYPGNPYPNDPYAGGPYSGGSYSDTPQW